MAKESGAAPKVWKYLGKEVSKSAATEGLTESAQEAIGAYAEQIAGSTKGLLDPENIQKYKEAFVKGAVGGAGFGVPGGIAAGRTAKKDYANTQEANEALKQQAAQEEAARLQQGTAFQPDGGLEKGDAYKKAAQNHDAGTMGGTHEYEHDTIDGGKTKSQSTRHWGSSDHTYTTPKEQK
jgi:hypothetical protein